MMGALQGSLTFGRYFVEGDLPRDIATTFERALEARRFLPASPAAEPPESVGWVAMEAPFDDDRAITRELFMFGNRVALCYREDKYVVPRAMVRRALQKKLQDIEQAEGKSREDMPRAFIKAVERAVADELRQKSLPKSSLVDVIWELDRGEARVFGRGKMVSERLSALFERTFTMRLVPAVPVARAFRLDLSQRARGVLERLMPEDIFAIEDVTQLG
jgi:DNA recombination-dependent growth factor C